MKQGWNRRYIMHWLWCMQGLRKSSRVGGVIFVVASLALGFPEPSASVTSVPTAAASPARPVTVPSITQAEMKEKIARQVASIDAFLELHQVSEENRSRLAESLVASGRKHGISPKLLASVMIVESRGNPFAISGQDAVGVMQVHLPTWGDTADRENINLLKIEDNVDFGARILKEYVSRFGVAGGLRRYNGYIPGEPTWEESSQRYLDKIQHVYGNHQLSSVS
jgi:soluble lytic murein transglycosylase-like protein